MAIDLDKALTEMINQVVEGDDQVKEILQVGATSNNTTVGTYRSQDGQELGFELFSDGKLEVFELKQ